METQQCELCEQDIPVANVDMHTAVCSRHNTKCPQCGMAMRKVELEEHIEERHTMVKCECGEEMNAGDLEEHKGTSCVNREVECPFCELKFPAHDESHRQYCGSRTEKCYACNKFIKLADFEMHQDTGCQYPLPDEPPPRPAPTASDAETTLDQLRAEALNDFFYLPNEGQPSSSNMSSNRPAPITTTSPSPNPFRRVNPQSPVSPEELSAAERRVHELRSQLQRDAPLLASSTSPLPRPDPVQASVAGSAGGEAPVTQCDFCGQPLSGMDAYMVHVQFECVVSKTPSPRGGGNSSNSPPSAARSTDVAPPSQLHPALGFSSSIPFDVSDLSASLMADIQGGMGPGAPSAAAGAGHPQSPSQIPQTLLDDFPLPDEELTMLPCEFCDELFPFDDLVQHQSGCDRRPNQTRTATGATADRRGSATGPAARATTTTTTTARRPRPSSGSSSRNNRGGRGRGMTQPSAPRPQREIPTAPSGRSVAGGSGVTVRTGSSAVGDRPVRATSRGRGRGSSFAAGRMNEGVSGSGNGNGSESGSGSGSGSGRSRPRGSVTTTRSGRGKGDSSRGRGLR